MPIFLKFCEKKKSEKKFGLKDIYSFMNPDESKGIEKTCKFICQEYFIWFLTKRFSIHVITSDQCEEKDAYIKGANMLKYLPHLRNRITI